MLIHKGTKRLETSRLILRRAVSNDGDAMYRNWASDPDVVRYLSWQIHDNEDVSKNIVQSWIDEYKHDNFYQWLIVLKGMNEPIGCISGMSLNEELESIEIGYCIGSKWWHRGIMTEALQAVIRYLFLECGFNRITARHDPANPHSGDVMKKCGMKFEGISRQADRNNQGICDALHYAILRSDDQGTGQGMESAFSK